MKLIEGFDSNYRYVLVAARRARQLQNGARPVVDPHSRKACRIAEEEIHAGKVKWEVPAKDAAAMQATSEPQAGPDGPVGGEADD
jgi:DNA-directed RNA polymerase subunit omega